VKPVTPRRQKIFARCALAAFVLAAGGWLAHLDYATKISTNVLDLIPTDEQAPELGVVRNLADALQARVLLFTVRDPAAPGTPPLAAARALAAALAAAPEFAEAVPMGEDDSRTQMGRIIFDQRFALLLPSWLAEQERDFAAARRPRPDYSSWVAERTATRLEAFLNRPEAVPMQDLVLVDPLLLVPGLLDTARAFDDSSGDSGGEALVWARITQSPLSEPGQQPVFAAIDRAFAAVQASHPGVAFRWTGVNRFAAASRARIEAEIKVLNLCSLLAVAAVGVLFVRRLWKLLHLVPVVVCSLLGAWTVSTLVFARLHILVFVIGALLSGVAIDYGFYIFMQPSLRPDETYAQKLGRLLKPLLSSCLTTVIGFSLLLWSDLPLIRQVGLFVSAGLLCALGSAMLYFAQLERPFLETRAFGHRAAPAPRPGRRAFLRGLAIAAAAVALLGPWRLHWRDDVRELDLPAPELQANDQLVRDRFGDRADRAIYLTYGANVTEARQHLDEFLAYERRQAPQASATSLGLVFPTAADYAALPARLALLRGFPDDLRAALAQHGFRPESFSGFFLEWDALQRRPPTGDYPALYTRFGSALKGPLGQLYQPHGPLAWFLTLVDGPEGPIPPAELHTVSLNQLQSLNRLFTHYRWSALRLSVLGLALIIASVFVIYPFRRGLRIALIPAGSCFFVFGVLGLGGATLNLFHLLGAFLGVCLAHNYSIFSSDSSLAGTAPPVSVRLSALCAAASFGVLGCSHIPVVHALGLTVALIVLTAAVAVEIEPLLRGNHRGSA
jgi:predicted exporter